MRAARTNDADSAISTVMLFILALLLQGVAQAERLPVKSFTVADGLAGDGVARIRRDSRGFLWFCTGDGLSRFDGYRFTNYTTAQGLPHRNVTDLLETRDGTYWVATGGGLCLFNPTGSPEMQAGLNRDQRKDQPAAANGLEPKAMFITYLPDEKKATYIRSLLEDHAGTIWVGTSDGLYCLEQVDGFWLLRRIEIGTPSETIDDAIILAMMEDKQATLWLATGSGLYRRYTDGRVERYTTRDGLPSNFAHALLEDREGRIWAGTRYGGVCVITAGQAGERSTISRVYSTKNGLPTDWITELFQSSDGRLWIGSAKALIEFIPKGDHDDQPFKSYTTGQGLNGNYITAIAEDRDGNLWLASDGVMKVSRNGFITYYESDGLVPDETQLIYENQAGELCALTSSSRGIYISRFNDGHFAAFRIRVPGHISNMGWGTHNVILEDHMGETWVATGEGLCRYPKVKNLERLASTPPKAVYTTRDGLYSNDVFQLFEDSRGDIWVSTISPTLGLDRVVRWERATEKIRRYSAVDGIPSGNSPTAFCEDASGNLWIGFYLGGLARYSSGRFEFFTTDEGVPPGIIHHFYRDRAGRLWVASGAGGLCRIDDAGADLPRFVKYTTAQGLTSNQIICVAEDGQGRLYLATTRGMDRLDPITGQVKHYTTADGLAENRLNLAFRDRHGALWVGGHKGISRLIPGAEQSGVPPPVLIGGLRVPGLSYRISELGETEIRLPDLGPNQNQIQVEFFGLSFAIGETLSYQYKLEGADREWSAPSSERSVSLSLSPGAYRLLVRAISSDGGASLTPAVVSFKILRPIWQRWWFVSTTAVLLALAAYALYRYRVKRLIELERVRMRIATDLHDDIGSNLSLIAMLSEVARLQVPKGIPDVSDRLELMARISRQSVDAMSDIVWAVNPKRDHLHDLTERMRRFASDTFTARDIEFQFSTSGASHDTKLGSDFRRQVYMIFKEGVNNIAKHSLCSEAEIDIGISGGQLTLKLKDNGKGFDIKRASNGYGGNGLVSMQRRAESVGGNLEIISREGEGTTITLKVRV